MVIFIVSVAAVTGVVGDSVAVEVVVLLNGDGDETLDVFATVAGVGVMLGCVLLVDIGRDVILGDVVVVVAVVVVVVSDCDIVRVVDDMETDAGEGMIAGFAVVLGDM